MGYAYNLVRPVRLGQRAAVLYPLLSGTLVFESLDTAHSYKEFMATVRRYPRRISVCLVMRLHVAHTNHHLLVGIFYHTGALGGRHQWRDLIVHCTTAAMHGM